MEFEKRLIEGNFPCQQVGAETRRERSASSMLPPVYYLHVWWARRPLTPSRAAILGGILPATTNVHSFLSELGLVKKQAIIGEQRWTLVGKMLELIEEDELGEFLPFSTKLNKAFDKENERRAAVRNYLNLIVSKEPGLCEDSAFVKWYSENQPLPIQGLKGRISVEAVAADPAGINERIVFASNVSALLGEKIKIDPEDMYTYDRAYKSPVKAEYNDITVLDPTAGGGSIPFEAARLGCHVIANDLNPVATGIEIATVEYPIKYGISLAKDIIKYGTRLSQIVSEKTKVFYNFEKPFGSEKQQLLRICGGSSELFGKYDVPEIDQQGLLYYREVTCPHCGERAPLLNAFALQKKDNGWMVVPHIETVEGKKRVRFVPVRLHALKSGELVGPNGEKPDEGTETDGVGKCIFCGQAIESDEIKRQAQGISTFGKMTDMLYCIAAVREQPKLDKDGKISTYSSGPDKGKIRTEKITFFREPTKRDFEALDKAEESLKENWDHWESMDLIPTERIPEGHKTAEPLRVGMDRWCDMFTSRQLIGLLTTVEELRSMIPLILREQGNERGTAIVHYLQYAIDKCINYNSRQTPWHSTRGVMSSAFVRHDFSFKWTFGEMVYTGPNTVLQWGLENVVKAYRELCELVPRNRGNITILNGSAASMSIDDSSVDVICMDPPYYNNVQYAELSDFFYVWQKRVFNDLYPELFSRRLTNKKDEAVANPARDGSAAKANEAYESLMSEIFAECRRVIKDDGIMVLMFTHKTQEAWETLTQALIQNGWIITSAFPVESEDLKGIHHRDVAASTSSIFLACRKRDMKDHEPSVWNGFGGTGVMQQIRKAVRQSLKDYEILHLNSVDEMVASYGSALKVLSENWPVMDGDEMVSPIRAMQEASTVVAQYQMTKLTDGRLSVDDISAEAAIALTLFGINGTGYFAFDDALSLSKSLNIRLEYKAAGYRDEGRMIGINDERTGRTRTGEEEEGYYAPVVKKGSKLRLVLPEERNPKRLAAPQSEWDIMHGMIMAFREGDIPVARAYLQRHAEGREDKVIGVLRVWADGCGSEELKKEAQRILFGLKDGK